MQDDTSKQPAANGQTQSGLARFGIKLCVSISVALALLGAGEGIAYLYLPKMVHPLSDYKAYVLWQTARTGSAERSLDIDGLRRTLYSHCEDKAYTIWMFGSSSMWGTANRDSETIASMVAQRYEESGHPACVKNYGEIGWVSTQEIISLMLNLKRAKRKPDAVILYDGSLDTFLPYESDQGDVHAGFPQFKQRFESWGAGDQAGFEYMRNTNTYRALQRVAFEHGFLNEAAAARSSSPEQVTAMARGTLENYLKNMEVLDGLATHYGFHYLCFWEPYFLAIERPLSASEVLIREKMDKKYPGLAPVERATYDLFRTLKRPGFVYLGDLFNEPDEKIFLDSSHIRSEGNRTVAQRFYQALQNLGP